MKRVLVLVSLFASSLLIANQKATVGQSAVVCGYDRGGFPNRAVDDLNSELAKESLVVLVNGAKVTFKAPKVSAVSFAPGAQSAWACVTVTQE